MAIAKEIEGYPDYYVSSAGNVWSKKDNETFLKLRACKRKDGYLKVNLRNDGKTYLKLVHRLVAEAHIQNPENKPCVDHINGIRSDNRVENLRWCTQQENCSFPLARKHYSEAKKGRQSPTKGKPRPEGAGVPPKQVIQYTKKGVLIATYASAMDAERLTNVAHQSICTCCKGKLKTAGGYKWAYLD